MSQMGVFKVDITPPLGIDFIGYHREEGAKGILDRLYATAFVFEHKGAKTVMLSVDNIGLLVEDTNVIRDEIATKLHLLTEHIMVLYTHTHSGPETVSEKSLVQAYKVALIQNCVQAAIHANERLHPCCIGWGVTHGNLGVNRRELGPNGKVIMGTNFEGPVDPRIGVLAIKDAHTEKMAGIIAFCTAHPNVLRGDSYLLSADYPGRTRQLLEQIYDCPVIVVQGGTGNVNARWRGSVQDLEKMAQTLSGYVLTVIPELKFSPITYLSSKSVTHVMSLKPIPDETGIIKMAQTASETWGVSTKSWEKALLQKYNQGDRVLTLDVEIQMFRLNEGAFAGIPMEPFSETALAVKEALTNEVIFFGGYTNGYLGYLPTKEAYPFGGYEVELNPVVYGEITGLWMPPEETTAEHMIEKVKFLYMAGSNKGKITQS